jgi:DNA-binding NarL/FixJ family response regulator
MGDGERGLRLANAMTWFWSSRGYFREARGWLEAFLVMPTSVATHARGLVEAANILHWQGDKEQAARCAAESLAICQAHGDQLNAAVALRRLASIAIDQQAFDRAAAFLAESGEIVRSVGSAWDAAFAVFLTGRLARAAGRSGEAVDRFAEASEAFGAIGDRGYVAAALGQQGAALIDTGDLAAAAAAYGTSLELASELKDDTWVAWALVGAAQLAHLSTKPDTAARFLSAASRIRESIGERRLPNSVLTTELKSTLGEDRFASEWTRGEQMPAAEIVAEARAILNGRHARQPDLATESPKQSPLSRRERQVLALVLAGRSDRDIGTALYISRRTASNHVSAILRKLQVDTRADAVACAVRDALI